MFSRDSVGTEGIAPAGMRAGVAALALQRQRHLLAVLAHPADLACRNADHEGMGLDVFVDHGASADEGEFADGEAAEDAFFQGDVVVDGDVVRVRRPQGRGCIGRGGGRGGGCARARGGWRLVGV